MRRKTDIPARPFVLRFPSALAFSLSVSFPSAGSARSDAGMLECLEAEGDALLSFERSEGGAWRAVLRRSPDGEGQGAFGPLEFPCVELPPRGDTTYEEVAACGGEWEGGPKMEIVLGFGGFLHTWSASARAGGIVDAFFFCRSGPGANPRVWGNSNQSNTSKGRRWRDGSG